MKQRDQLHGEHEDQVYYLQAVDAENLYVPSPRSQPLSAKVVLELVPVADSSHQGPAGTWDPHSFDDRDLDLTIERERSILAWREPFLEESPAPRQPEFKSEGTAERTPTNSDDGFPAEGPTDEQLAKESEPDADDSDEVWLDTLPPDSDSSAENVDPLAFEGIEDELLDPDPSGKRAELQAEIDVTGTVPRSTRARLEAIKLVLSTGWDPSGVEVLTRILDRYWWSRAKEAVRQQIELGASVGDIELALEARSVWEEHPEFADSHLRYPFERMSWPAAIEFAHAFASIPSREEIDLLLTEAFDCWRRSAYLRFSSFHDFVRWLSRCTDPNELSSPNAVAELMPCEGVQCHEDPWVRDALRCNARLSDDYDS
jgi:hypothetical protein